MASTSFRNISTATRSFAPGFRVGSGWLIFLIRLDRAKTPFLFRNRVRVNPARVDLERLQPGDLEIVQQMIRNHYAYTRSEHAREILDKWEDCAPRFVKVHPRDLKLALASRLEEKTGDG